MNPRCPRRTVKARMLALLTVVPALILFLSPPVVTAQQGARMPAFADVDTDGDGFVSESELAAFRAQRMAQSAAEGRPMARAADVPTFADIDTDADGKLSPQELEAFHQRQGRGGPMAGTRRGQGAGNAAGQSPVRRAGRGPAGARRQVATFEEIDLDGDGCIDREELAEHHRVRGKTDS